MHGNTVGSREGLSFRQKAILIGKILGDGCLEKNGPHVRLKIEQGESQKQYVFWLFEQFKNLVAKPPYSLFHKGRGGKSTKRWRFSTRTLTVFDEYFFRFYVNRKKVIPSLIQNDLIHPVTLATWYMDDGYLRTDHSGAYLCTSSFTVAENKLLQKSLLNVYGLETAIHFAGKYPKLHIPSRSLQHFLTLVEPYVIECFNYKLSLTP